VSIAWRWPIVVAGSIELAVSIAWRWPIVVAGRTELAVCAAVARQWPIVVAGSIELAVCAAVARRWPIVVAGRWPVVRRVALASAAAAIESRAAGAASCSGNERGEGSAS